MVGAVWVGTREDDPGSPAPGDTARATYRPHLDGLRAIAVYLVVAFHAGSGVLTGGFIGVDVFFVLSGYLVTQLLLRDLVGRGGIRFARFYARRFRRLLPAAFVALLATAAVFTVIATPSQLIGVTGAFRAAFLYSTNWYFVHHSANYFGAGVQTNPVLHFWSLAVEEQFYLVWPLALAALFAVTRRFADRQRSAIRIIVGVLVLISVARALALRTSDPNWAYYGSDARAYQLLAGASIALVPSLVFASRYRRALRIAGAVSFVTLLFLATSLVHFDAIERGIAVAATASVLIVALELADGGAIKWLLSTSPFVYLGRVSYGTYLWHWIVILVLTAKFDLGTGAQIAVAAVVATGMASLSFQLLEQPVRLSRLLDRHRIAVIAGGLAISVVSAVVFIPAIVDRTDSTPLVLPGNPVGFTPVPSGIDYLGVLRQALKEGGPFINCVDKPADACTIVRGPGTHILLMGDSHAWMLIPTFTAIARKEHLTLTVSVHALCPWQRDAYPAATTVKGSPTDPRRCVAFQRDLYSRIIPTIRPDLIVATEATYETPSHRWVDASGRPRHFGVKQLESAATASIKQMQESGARVLVIEPTPNLGDNPLLCLAKARVVEECRALARTQPSSLSMLYRKLARTDPRFSDINMDRLVCPFLPICDPIVNGAIVRFDNDHLTAAFAKTIAPALDADLKQRQLIQR